MLKKKLIAQIYLLNVLGGDGGNGTGSITVTGTFDREQASIVTVDIQMCDLRGTTRSDIMCGTRHLHINIGDVNDNKHSAGYQYITVYNYKGLLSEIVLFGFISINTKINFIRWKANVLL